MPSTQDSMFLPVKWYAQKWSKINSFNKGDKNSSRYSKTGRLKAFMVSGFAPKQKGNLEKKFRNALLSHTGHSVQNNPPLDAKSKHDEIHISFEVFC